MHVDIKLKNYTIASLTLQMQIVRKFFQGHEIPKAVNMNRKQVQTTRGCQRLEEN